RIRTQAPLPQVLRSPDKAAGRIRGRRGTTCRWAFPDALRLSGLRAGRLPPSPAPGIVGRTSLPPDDAMQLRATRALPLLLATAFAAANAQAAAQTPVPPAYAGTTADAVLTAARIHTLDASRPQATAIAWDKDGRIVATGDAAELRHRYPQARLVDAGDATVIPGLIDAHAHVMELGYALLRADLSGAKSTQEVIERLQAYAASAPEGSWIIGWGWDQNLWPGAQFPTAADLDAAFPDRPVWLSRIDGHAAWANTAAIRAAEALEGARRFDGDWQPDGGRIERDGTRATGVFVDAAMR